jgi:hypothetical protein
MITNFESITEELNEEELKLIPILVKGFKSHGKNDPIKAPEIIKAINEKRQSLGLKNKFSEPRLRKCSNYIRSNGILPLIATSNGYYTSYDRDEIMAQIQSLNERANSILKSAEGLKQFLKK